MKLAVSFTKITCYRTVRNCQAYCFYQLWLTGKKKRSYGSPLNLHVLFSALKWCGKLCDWNNTLSAGYLKALHHEKLRSWKPSSATLGEFRRPVSIRKSQYLFFLHPHKKEHWIEWTCLLLPFRTKGPRDIHKTNDERASNLGEVWLLFFFK